MGEFLPLLLPELAGGLLFVFLKKDGGLRPLLCGSIWRRCIDMLSLAARLTSDCTRDTAHTYFTTTYLNFMQYAGGLQHGTTRYAQLLNMLQGLPTDDQDPDDHVTFINTDIKAVFQEMCRQASIDTLTGKATQKKKCCLLVLNSVTSLPRWIRQPQLRAMHGVCVFPPPSLLFVLLRHRILRMSPPLSFPAPQLSHYTIQTYSRRHLSLTVSSTLPPLPLLALRASVSHPPSTQASTIHNLCDNLKY